MVSDLNDRKYMKYSNSRFMHHTISSQLRYLEFFVDSLNQYAGGFFKEMSDLAVTLTFFINQNHRTAGVGILVLSNAAVKKIGFEAYAASIRYLFEVCGIRKVTGGTLSANVKMVKIFERLGFALEGVCKKHEIVGSQEVDTLLFGKFNV